MRKTIMEKLGLEPVRKLNATICRARVKHLEKALARKKVPNRLVGHAEYYARWYAWMAKNGGNRAAKRKVA